MMDSSRFQMILTGRRSLAAARAEHDLNRHVLTAAKSAAHRLVNHPHLIQRQVQRMRDLLLVLVRPLAGDVYRHPAGLVDVSQPGLGLQIGVLLIRSVVFSLQHHVGRFPAGRHVAAPHDEMHQLVAGGVGVQLGRVGRQRLFHTVNAGQFFPFDLDQIAGGGRLLFRLGNHQRHLVPFPSHQVAPGLAGSGAAEHRLIGHLQAVFIVRHVAGGKNRHHTGSCFGATGIDALDAAGRAAGKEDLEV